MSASIHALVLAARLVAGPDVPPREAGDDDTTIVATVAREAEAVVLRVQGCEELDAAELARLLDLELQGVTTEIRDGPPLQVATTCRDDAITIEITDPLTRKQLRREIPPLPDDPGRERLLALAVSELFSASWLELVAGPPPEDTPQPVAPPRPVRPEAVAAATETAAVRTRVPRGLALLLGAGARGRDLAGEPFAAARVDLLLRGWLTPALGLAALVGWDYGQSTRTFGRARGHAVSAAGGLAWRWRAREAIGLGGQVLAGLAWARLTAQASAAGVPTGRTSGVSGELSAGLGPRVSAGRLRVDLDGELGWMLRTPSGDVAGEPPFRLGGLWIGAALRVGVDLRRPSPR